MKYRLLIVEDEALVAAMIIEALSESNYQVSATAMDMSTALTYLENEKFDAALLDINLDGNFEGIEIGRLIRDKYKIPFLFLTAHADQQTISQAKITEPAGYIVKPFNERELLAGLEIALYNFKRKTNNENKLPTIGQINSKLHDPISEREMEVISLIYQGKRNSEIATALFVSVNTIKTHLLRMYSKFGVRSRTELLAELRKIG